MLAEGENDQSDYPARQQELAIVTKNDLTRHNLTISSQIFNATQRRIIVNNISSDFSTVKNN